MTKIDWTDLDPIIRARYPHENTQRLADELKIHGPTLRSHAVKLGIKKSEAFLKSLESTRFSALRNSHFVPNNLGRRFKHKPGTPLPATAFKKGHVPHNATPIGTERISAGYIFVKVAHDHRHGWIQKHYLVWQQHTGQEVPKGHAIWFRDRNPLNCAFENLELITDAERGRRSPRHHYPEDIKSLMQLRGTITRRLKKLGVEP